jgi:peptidoglycan/xylan/chitin deacetylase (PgdA/CDA1 family)
MVNDRDIIHVKHLYNYKKQKQFKKDLDYFLKNYKSISMYDLINVIYCNKKIPRKSFLLTFDDGYREIYEVVVPILKEKGISATFFLTTDFIDNKKLFYRNKSSILIENIQKHSSTIILKEIKNILQKNKIVFNNFKENILSLDYSQQFILDEIARIIEFDFNEYLRIEKPYLSTKQVNDLISEGFTIGAHSIDHPIYPLLSLEEQIFQTSESVKRLKEKFTLDNGIFAFPNSDRGILNNFFIELYKNNIVDATFGTSGINYQVSSPNLQRLSMEDDFVNASETISFNYLKGIFNNINKIFL